MLCCRRGYASVSSIPPRQQHKVVFVLGGPGSGKGTQCANLVKEFPLQHLSAGDLLRAEVASGSPGGIEIETFLKEGLIVPVRTSLGLLKKAMFECSTSSNDQLFLVDGFPRNEDNVRGWEEHMSRDAEVLAVLFFDCSEQEMEKRLISRGLSSGRSDDNLESARKRFRTYVTETLPVVRIFEERGLLLRVDAEGSQEEVHFRTMEALQKKGLLP